MKRQVVLSAAVFVAWSLSAAFRYESTMTVAGYHGAETLVGFPVLVRISASKPSGFSYSFCRPDGADIQFLSTDGETVYPHEIETWDPSGESLVWVRMPALSGTDTQFSFRFGDASVASAPESKGACASCAGGDYAGVWHFAEEIDAEAAATTAGNVNTGAALAYDSAKHDVNLSMDAVPKKGGNGDFSMMISTNGVIGLARQNATANIDGNNHNKWNGNYLSVSNYDSLAIGGTFTVSGWFKQYVGKGCQCFFARGDRNTANTWGIEQNINYVNSPYFWCGAQNQAAAELDFSVKWRHVAMTVNGSTVTVYVDGANKTTKIFDAAAVDNGIDLRFGKSSDASWHGAYDEIRLLGVTVGDDWIKAEYDSVNDPSFVTAGEVRTLSRDMLTITAVPEELGVVSPVYQVNDSLADGAVVNLTAPDGEQVISESLRIRFAGWKLFAKSGDAYVLVDSALTNQYRYVHQSGTVARFEWQVVRSVPVSAAVTGAGAVRIDGQGVSSKWCVEGEAELQATPSDGYAFGYWSGDVAGIADVTRPAIRIEGASSRNLTANFRKGPAQYRYICAMEVAGYEGTETLTNFPVLVRISRAIVNFDYAGCAPGGAGVAFFSPDGTRAYPFEVDTWNPSGESLVWVRLPLVAPAGAQFTFAYHPKAIDAAYPSRQTWRNAQDGYYAGVWHLGEEIDVSAAAAGTAVSADSAEHDPLLDLDAVPGKGNNGDYSMMYSTNGVIGRARQNASADIAGNNHNKWNGNYLSVPSYESFGIDASFTFSGWFNQNVGIGYQNFFARGDAASAKGSENGWGVFQNINSTNFPEGWSGTTVFFGTTSVNFLDAWRHLVFVADGTNATVYVDGEKLIGTSRAQPLVDNSMPLCFGRDISGGASFHGSMDELRLLSRPASACWIKAEFAAVSNPSFVTAAKVRDTRRGFMVVVR